MQAVVAIWETEIEIATAEFHLVYALALLTHTTVVSLQDGRVIHGVTVAGLQHTALQPHLVRSRKHGNIIQQYRVITEISEQERARFGVQQGLQLSLITGQLMKEYVFRGCSFHEIREVLEHGIVDFKFLCHHAEDGIKPATADATELHQTQQQQRLLASTYLAVQVLADGGRHSLRIKTFGHFVSTTHIAVEIKVEIHIANAEVVAQIAHEHTLCPCFVNILLFAEQGKKTQKGGEYNISHLVCIGLQKYGLIPKALSTY